MAPVFIAVYLSVGVALWLLTKSWFMNPEQWVAAVFFMTVFWFPLFIVILTIWIVVRLKEL